MNTFLISTGGFLKKWELKTYGPAQAETFPNVFADYIERNLPTFQDQPAELKNASQLSLLENIPLKETIFQLLLPPFSP